MIIFTHVPKTAGSTINEAAIALLQSGWLKVKGPADIDATSDKTSLRYIGGHVHFAAAVERFPEATFVASLRRPLHRVLSHYMMLLRDDPDAPEAVSFRAFYDHHITKKKRDNLQCRFLCGEPSAARAIESIRTNYTLVWTVSRVDDAWHRLREMLTGEAGVLGPPPTRMRVGDNAPASYDTYLPDELASFVLTDNAEDTALFDWLEREHGGIFHDVRQEVRRRHVAAIFRQIDTAAFEAMRPRYRKHGKAKYLDFAQDIPRNVLLCDQLGLTGVPPRHILDIGCGAGLFLRCARHFGHTGLGIDSSKFYTEAAALHGIEHLIVRVDPFARLNVPGTFDLITCIATQFDRTRDRQGKMVKPWGAAEWIFFLTDIRSLLVETGRLFLWPNKGYHRNLARALGPFRLGGHQYLLDRDAIDRVIADLAPQEPPMKTSTTPFLDFAEIIQRHGVDYLDYGSKLGGSLNYARSVFEGRQGLGIELQPERAAKANADGHLVVVADATTIAPPENCVSFSMLVHFLEHMPSYDMAEKCIASAARASRDFVYMRHPWFDSDSELLRLGYKLYWSDWRVHKTHFNTLDFVKAIQRIGIEGRWVLMGVKPIRTTQHHALVRADAAMDSYRAEADEVAARPLVEFRSPVFHETACLIQTGSNERFEWARSKLEKHETLIEGKGREVLSAA